MIVEFRCMNDDCSYLGNTACDQCGGEGGVEYQPPFRRDPGYSETVECDMCEGAGKVVDDADRFTWYGGKMAATRIDPSCYTDEECKHCGESGEEIGQYTARELREEMDPRL